MSTLQYQTLLGHGSNQLCNSLLQLHAAGPRVTTPELIA